VPRGARLGTLGNAAGACDEHTGIASPTISRLPSRAHARGGGQKGQSLGCGTRLSAPPEQGGK
jgi:hypothetical protein